MFKSIEWFLLDMDGTIYLDDTLIEGAKEFLQTIESTGRRFIFLTNNSSKNKKAYQKKLSKFGIEVSEEHIFTSGEATTIHLNGLKPGASIFLLGNNYLANEFEEAGFHLSNDTDQTPDFVVLGFDTTLTYDKIHQAADHLRSGVPFLATHPDLNCPLKDGAYMPDTGSMIKMLESSTGVSPKIIGKPNKSLIDTIMIKYGIKDKNALCMVGDRLYTDIRLANNAGIPSVLVLSGETKEDDLKCETVLPSATFDSVRGLTEILLKTEAFNRPT